MINYKWSYCLSEEQFNSLNRIIKKVRGFEIFLSMHNIDDLRILIVSFLEQIENNGTSTPGIRVNLDVISKKYDVWRKEYEDNHPQPVEFNIDKIITWYPRPKWAEPMTIEEIDYLDHFVYKIPGFSEYLYANKNATNLYDLAVFYQMRLSAVGQNDPDLNFLFGVIKERFYRIMGDHDEAIHYVNHSHTINDTKVIDDFVKDANERFYLINLEENDCSKFITQYENNQNPYISGEIFIRLFRANRIEEALSIVKQSGKYIFSAPNIYWHNKEAIYGSVNILNTLIYALGYEGYNNLKDKQPKMASCMLGTLYLLLSRIIYWSDKETFNNDSYDDDRMPITIQHKLRAYRLRAYLIDNYGKYLTGEESDANNSIMALSDLYSAHEMAFVNKIVGKESIYKRDAIKLFHTRGLYKLNSLELISEEGFFKNDELARQMHKKYKNGELCFKHGEVSGLIAYLKMQFKSQLSVALENDSPIPYLVEDNFSPSYKKDKELIRQYLQHNGIKYFYHFTEKDRLKSIIKHGGLLSYKRCLDEGVVMPVREDMALSKDKDAKLGLEDYARLSFCRRIPLIKTRQNEGAELIMLKISTEVALFEETQFTDIEATQLNLKHGKTFEDLKRVNISATRKEYCDDKDPEYFQSQAEILVKGLIPLKYIVNISNPEQI